MPYSGNGKMIRQRAIKMFIALKLYVFRYNIIRQFIIQLCRKENTGAILLNLMYILLIPGQIFNIKMQYTTDKVSQYVRPVCRKFLHHRR